MRPILSLLVLGAPLVVGCGTYVGFTEINRPPHALSARSPRSVEVYSSSPPARRHVDVAIVEAEQTHSLNEQGTALMIRRMPEQAAAIGCDAIVLGGATDHDGAQAGTALALLDPGSTKRQATCIVYDDPPTRPFTRTARVRAPSPDVDQLAADQRRPQAQDGEDPAER